MRKNAMKLMTVGGMFSVVCLGVTGCGKMTPEKLVAEMAKAEADKTCVSTDLNMEMDVSYSMNLMGIDISADMGMLMDGAMIISTDPVSAYLDMDMQMEIADQYNEDVPMQAYAVMEDGVFVIYVQNEMTGEWARTETGTELNEQIQNLKSGGVLSVDDFSNLELEEELTEVDGRQVYVLHVQMPMDFTSALSGMQMTLPEVELDPEDFADLEEFTVPVDIFVDKETFLLQRMDMNLEGMGEAFNAFFDELLKVIMSQAGGDLGDMDMDMSIDISRFQAVMSNISYEQQEVPAVPQEAYEAIEFQEALENIETDLGDGSYAIRTTGSVVKILTPEGYEAVDALENSVSFAAPDGMNMIAFEMVPASMEELYAESVVSTYTGILEASGMTVESGMDEQNIETAYGTVDGYWITGGGANIYYAMVPVKSAHLFVLITDFNGNELDSAAVLGYALEHVSELTAEDIL